MTKVIRIGTRDSPLAMWQSKAVQHILQQEGIRSELVPIKSTGDLNKEQPIHTIGTTGVFTKALDDALLKNDIDAAVHSLKDVPTLPAQGLYQGAVLERTAHTDVLITSTPADFLENTSLNATIATGSLRRKAQWLYRFPHHRITGIRGNVETRLKKLETENIDGTILSSAGIYRLEIQPEFMYPLDWMVPAPAQGVIGVFCRTEDTETKNFLTRINDPVTEMTSHMERQLLRTLEGGCTAPIGAFAHIHHQQVTLKACLLDPKGNKKIEMEKTLPVNDFRNLGELLASEMLNKGGAEVIEEIKRGE